MRSERGFTLIELLVVIAILAILFGATALALAGVGDSAESAAANGERDVVQTALDVCDAISTCDFTLGVPTSGCGQVGPSTGEMGSYLRRTSQFYYDWNTTTGAISAQGTDALCTAIP